MTHKSVKNIFIAFILNLGFSLFEFIGGALTGSIAILSDAIHDMGDALTIGLSYFLEKKSLKKPDETYTYGYMRFSLIGSIISTLVLISGSIFVIYNAIKRIINPVSINYNGVLLLAIAGFIINLIAAYVTKEGDSLNQKSVNLHMLEDVLGWFVVLIGAIIMRFTSISLIDPILSIFVAAFIFLHAAKHFKIIIDLFLIKTPHDINIKSLKDHLLTIPDILDIHHIHVWSLDGLNNYATLHVVSNTSPQKIKKLVKEELKEFNIIHSTIEIETAKETCEEKDCHITESPVTHHHH